MKGISPLIASVMLVAFSVAIGSLFFGWMTTFTKDTTQSVEKKAEESLDCQTASIAIDKVYIDTSANTAMVIARNDGYVNNLEMTGAIVYNTTGYNCTLNSSSLDTDFDKSDIASVHFTECPIDTCPDDFEKAIISTNCGSVDATYDSNPNCI